MHAKRTATTTVAVLLLMAAALAGGFIVARLLPDLLPMPVEQPVEADHSPYADPDVFYYDGTGNQINQYTQFIQDNENVIGWITIPGTSIDKPILTGKDNNYYLHHDMYGNPDENGTVFLNSYAWQNFSDPMNVLLAHNMPSGSMFQDIEEFFLDQEFLDNANGMVVYSEHNTYKLLPLFIAKIPETYGWALQARFDSVESFYDYMIKLADQTVLTRNGAGKIQITESKKFFGFITCVTGQDAFRYILICEATAIE